MIKKLLVLLSLLPALALAQTYPSPTYNNLTLIHPLPIASGGTGASTAAAALSALGADPIGSAANRNIYVSTSGNDSNSGATWGLAKLTLQAGLNAAAGGTGGIVHVGAGTYSQTAIVLMQPNVRLLCTDGAVITQPNAQNLVEQFDFVSNSANGASIENCTIDGNRSGNTDTVSNAAIYTGSANDVVITGNTLQNFTGSVISMASPLRYRITNNKLTNFRGIGISVNSVASTAAQGLIAFNKILAPFSYFAIGTVQSDYTTIQGNIVVGSQQVGTNLSISGTAVTWVSGPTFSASMAGQTIVYNGATEATINTVNSSTSMTLLSAGTTVTNVPAIIGSADLVNVANSSFNTIIGNNIKGGATSSIVLHDFTGTEAAQKNIISNNVTGLNGEGCIYLSSAASSPQVLDNAVTNNMVYDCGVGGTTAGISPNVGIGLLDFAGNTIVRTYIDGNYVSYDGSTGVPMGYWADVSRLTVGNAFIGKNTGENMTNPGLFGGISTVALSAGWGTTATVTGIVSYGDAFLLTANSSGTGQAASPTITVNTRATTATVPPVMACQMVGGSGSITSIVGQIPSSGTSSALVQLVFSGTPMAGNTYQILCRG